MRANLTLWMTRGLLLLAVMMTALPARAGVVVIVNANSRVSQLSRDEVVNIFMGRYRRLGDGSVVQPVDVSGEAPERREFYSRLLGKTLAEVNAYWARLVFTGRTRPPLPVLSSSAVLNRVANDPSMIGYIDRKDVSDQVKVVFTLSE